MKGQKATGRGGSTARHLCRGARLPRVRVSLAWFLAYVLLAQLILTGFAAGVATAAGLQAGQPAVCTGLSDSGAPQEQAPHRAPHCLLCPQAGHVPLLPAAPALPDRTAVFGTAADATSRPAEARLWAIREGARTRAPPHPATDPA